MKIETLTWEKAIFTFDELVVDGAKSLVDEWPNVTVWFQDDALKIRSGDSHRLLSKPTLLELTPWQMRFEAYWWSGNFNKPSFDKQVKVDVVFKF